MRNYRAIGLLLAVATIACSRGAAKRDSASAVRDTSQLAEYLADSSCYFVRAQQHSDPDSLVAEFVKRDAAGEFLLYSPWLDSATVCPGHLPGPDAFTVVTDYRIAGQGKGRDTAKYLVIYRRVGSTRSDEKGATMIMEHLGIDTLPYTLLRTEYGWRVSEPQLPQFVTARASRPIFKGAERKRLDSLSRLTP